MIGFPRIAAKRAASLLAAFSFTAESSVVLR